MGMFDLNSILRENIKVLKPYTAARDEYKGTEGTFLDANENAFGSATADLHNRYPDPMQWEVKLALSKIKKIPAENIFIGNGSDEAIDILYRSFCRPSLDNAIITPPTYGMYEVSANINDVKLKKVPLNADFDIEVDRILAFVDENTKMIILCSPNNPTGNHLKTADIVKIIETFSGIVALDEAYIDFADEKSLLPFLLDYPNLVIMQTFSKAWGLANLRLGMAFASTEIIKIMNKVKPPYNINGVSQKMVLEALGNEIKKNEYVANILIERELLKKELEKLPIVTKIYPTDANFMLVKTNNGNKIYDYLITQKVIVRNRSTVSQIEECLRITVGTKEENEILISALQQYELLNVANGIN
ncbi:MAG: histidinol-phosphate transaminase [Cytophagales bacterium]